MGNVPGRSTRSLGSMKITIELRALPIHSSWLLACVGIFVCAAAFPTDSAKSVSYSGQITPFLVDNFIDNIKLDGATRLIVNSGGGDGAAGIKLGRWVKSHNLDVEVQGHCDSACANYVFLAGDRKIIAPRSIVLWHGSMEQKDVRELQRRYGELLLKSHRQRNSLTEEEALYLEKNREHFQSAVELRESQARFYDELQINEYITRLGQEPVQLENDWATASPRVMAHFGVRNVEAPDDYASCAYVRQATLFWGGASLFDLDRDNRVSRITCAAADPPPPMPKR